MNGNFVQGVIAFVALVGLLFGIFTSSASEAVKLFAVSMVAIGIIALYIFLKIEPRIKKLEGV